MQYKLGLQNNFLHYATADDYVLIIGFTI